MNSGFRLNINSFLNGAKGALDTAQKIIPIYDEAKPIINNIFKIRNNLKNFNLKNIFNKSKEQENIIDEDFLEEKRITNTSYSNPQFFL